MKTTMKILSLSIIAVFFASCSFTGVKGSKNVITQERTISEKFSEVKVSTGIDLYLTQGNNVSVTVEADDNIIDLLITEVKGDVLHVHFDKNIGRVESKKVYLTMPDIKSLKASSGADIVTKSKIKADKLNISASSGADIEAELEVNELICKSSSGSDIDLRGKSNKATVQASSGSEINASELIVNHVIAESSSGADITITANESLTADASSGADIRYKGSPKEKDIDKSSGGSVRSR